MKTNFLYIILTSIVLLSCSSQKDALKLNDTIVKANNDLRIASETFNKQFEAVSDNNYAVLEVDRQNMVNMIEKKITEISAEKSGMPGGDDFKNTFVDYYKFEKNIYEEEYKEICRLTGAEGDREKLTNIAMRMQAKTDREDAMEKSIHTEQAKFAKKNNLKLE